MTASKEHCVMRCLYRCAKDEPFDRHAVSDENFELRQSMNPTLMWIENLMMMLTGIMVIPVLFGAARPVAGYRVGAQESIAVDGREPTGLCRWREARDERIRLMFSRWRLSGVPIVLYQPVV